MGWRRLDDVYFVEYSSRMFTVRRTAMFDDWLRRLGDRRAMGRITSRILRAEDGNLGDTKSVGDGVNEMRIDYGPGYRLYFIREGQMIIVLLCGGDKSTQPGDISEAKRLAMEWRRRS
jgi:putative addiction module killer protein